MKPDYSLDNWNIINGGTQLEFEDNNHSAYINGLGNLVTEVSFQYDHYSEVWYINDNIVEIDLYMPSSGNVLLLGSNALATYDYPSYCASVLFVGEETALLHYCVWIDKNKMIYSETNKKIVEVSV